MIASRSFYLLRIAKCTTVLAFVFATPALAHGGEDHPPSLWRSWNGELILWAGLMLTAWLYVSGVRNAWNRSGRGQIITYWHATAFVAGFLAFFIALISPLDYLSEELFSAHMGQHILLALIAPLFFTLSAFHQAVLWALPRQQRRDWLPALKRLQHRFPAFFEIAWRLLTRPLVAWSLYVAILWGWHAPPFYQTAVLNETLHITEHVSLIITGLLYWWVILRLPQKGKAGEAFMIIFTTALINGILGVLILFSSQPWYPLYVERSSAWSLTALEDQQIAGALMWIPPSVVYLATALTILRVWLLKDEPYPRSEQLSPNTRKGTR